MKAQEIKVSMQGETNFTLKAVQVKDLKQGEFFTLKPTTLQTSKFTNVALLNVAKKNTVVPATMIFAQNVSTKVTKLFILTLFFKPKYENIN